MEDAGFLNGAALNLIPDTDAEMETKWEDAEEFETKFGAQLEVLSSDLKSQILFCPQQLQVIPRQEYEDAKITTSQVQWSVQRLDPFS